VAGVGDATAEAGWFNSEMVCGFGLAFRQNAEAAGPDTRPERLKKFGWGIYRDAAPLALDSDTMPR